MNKTLLNLWRRQKEWKELNTYGFLKTLLLKEPDSNGPCSVRNQLFQNQINFPLVWTFRETLLSKKSYSGGGELPL